MSEVQTFSQQKYRVATLLIHVLFPALIGI